MKTDLGLLLLRVTFAGMLLCRHGWGKLIHFSNTYTGFPDPLHVGSKISLGLAVFAEVFCAALVVVGIATRYACAPLIVTFLIIVFLVLGSTPFGQREMAVLYLTVFTVIALVGPGNFSLEHLMKKR